MRILHANRVLTPELREVHCRTQLPKSRTLRPSGRKRLTKRGFRLGGGVRRRTESDHHLGLEAVQLRFEPPLTCPLHAVQGINQEGSASAARPNWV